MVIAEETKTKHDRDLTCLLKRGFVNIKTLSALRFNELIENH